MIEQENFSQSKLLGVWGESLRKYFTNPTESCLLGLRGRPIAIAFSGVTTTGTGACPHVSARAQTHLNTRTHAQARTHTHTHTMVA